MEQLFKDMNDEFTEFIDKAEKFIKKMKAKSVHIPIKVVESEYFLGTTDGQTYTVTPRK